MDMSGEYRIPASREAVWKALNDPDVLRRSIPGCEEVVAITPEELQATVAAAVGPVKARFKGKVRLMDLNPPASYRLVGEGSGGPAGFAKGEAAVRLAADGDFTVLSFDAKAQIGGKLAQIGSRLIEGTARKMADEFFSRFAEIAAGARAGEVQAVKPAAPAKAAAAGGGLPPMVWIGGLVAVGIVVLGLLLVYG